MAGFGAWARNRRFSRQPLSKQLGVAPIPAEIDAGKAASQGTVLPGINRVSKGD